jgi:predicted small lipoprotein YifL
MTGPIGCRCVLAVLLVTILAGAVTGCGKKGDPVLPPGQKDDYPASYPQSTAPQTGVFSG